MTVYVDDARNRLGRMVMCHMIADTTQELLDMAEKIGLAHRWLQRPGTHQEHYDVCLQYRARAIRLGAEAITSRELVRILQARCKGLA